MAVLGALLSACGEADMRFETAGLDRASQELRQERRLIGSNRLALQLHFSLGIMDIVAALSPCQAPTMRVVMAVVEKLFQICIGGDGPARVDCKELAHTASNLLGHSGLG